MSDKYIEKVKLQQAIVTLVAFGILIVIAIFLFLPREQKWTAIYYPGIDNLQTYSSDPLKSIDACRAWVQNEAQRNNDKNYNYECGLNCRIDQDASDAIGETMRICKETLK